MTEKHRPLVMTADAELLDDMLGAAAAVGVAVDVAVDPGACRPQWTSAPLVLVGEDVRPALAGSALRPRPGVLVVRRGASEDATRAGAATDAEDVVSLPAGEAILLDRLADVAEPPASGRVIGVLSGRGGAGGSVLAAAIALTAVTRGDAAWLIDLDPLGGGADAGLGAELQAGARWDDLGSVAGRVSGGALRSAVPEVCGVAVLSCDPGADSDLTPAAVRAVLAATRRGGGTVLVDLPRHPGRARSEALAVLDEVLLVVPAEVRAVLAARQLTDRLVGSGPALRLVVRRVTAGLPPHEVARGLDLPLAGDYGEEPAVRAALLNGDPRDLVRGTELGALCHRLLDGSSVRARAS